jgi:hypothetical protein
MFAETEGWSIARHSGGCVMTREFGGDGNMMVTFAVDPGDDTSPLTILVGNSGWSLPDAETTATRSSSAAMMRSGTIWPPELSRPTTVATAIPTA